jgi:UDP-N-acetylglucosamine--N-acetylmuramyl-(pentapeptide) pyrophosphoryl-undecaprenol N-acetylglucosamine transferase
MSRPVYIVCGGTGGHLAPGIATAQRFREKGILVELVTSEKEIDSRLLKAYPDIPYRKGKGAPFGWSPMRLLSFIYNSLVGAIQAFFLLRQTRPVAVIAFGGFLSVSYVVAAWILKVPVILHEANRKPGKSIRRLAGMADRIFLPEGVVLKGVESSRIRRVDMPIRREIKHIPKSEIRERLGVPLHAKVLTVVGGSQGALVLNEWVKNNRKSLAAQGIWVFLVTGPGKMDMPEKEVLESDNGSVTEIRTFAFHNAMHELFSASDIVVGRAGAGTIAELAFCLTPSILIPYPYAADQHQLANARDLERRGGSIVVIQDNIQTLFREVMDMIYNDWLLGKMRNNLKRLIHHDSGMLICEFVTENYISESSSQSMGERAV